MRRKAANELMNYAAAIERDWAVTSPAPAAAKMGSVSLKRLNIGLPSPNRRLGCDMEVEKDKAIAHLRSTGRCQSNEPALLSLGKS